jgi:hypothetical protein
MSMPLTQYWTTARCAAAGALAAGHTMAEAAFQAGVHESTVFDWTRNPVFAEEVDRLTLMVGVASRAERLRIAMRVIRSRVDENGVVQSNKDALDWLKFAQSETDGVKLDIGKLLAAGDATDSGDNENRLLPSQHVGVEASVTKGDSGAVADSDSDGPSSLSLPPAPSEPDQLDQLGQSSETATSTNADMDHMDHLAQLSPTTPDSE